MASWDRSSGLNSLNGLKTLNTLNTLNGLDPYPVSLKPVSTVHEHSYCISSNDIQTAGESPSKLFHQRGHDARHLARLVKDCSKSSQASLNTLQKKTLEEFWSTSNRAKYQFYSHDGSDEAVIQAYFKVFDNFFFFGSLQVRTTAYISFSTHGTTLGLCSESDSTSWNESLQYNKICTVRISKDNTMKREDRLRNYVSVLLHEMIHAFMALYACRRYNCDREPENVGVTGHGEAWCDTAQALEKGVGKHFAIFLDMKAMISYARELRHAGGTPSSKIYEWRFDKSTIEYLIGRWKIQEQ